MNAMCIIRDEIEADAAAIRRVLESAFEGPDEARLVENLRNAGQAVITLVAVDGKHLVGHILFSPVTLEPENPNLRILGLAPLAVLPAHQGRGIGSLLVNEGLARCKQAGCDAVVVLGHPSYYPRFGFRRASDFGLDNEYDAGEAFMALELKVGALSDVAGLVKYRPEFEGV